MKRPIEIKEQIALLNSTIKENISLDKVLKKKGLTYDNFSYKSSSQQKSLFESEKYKPSVIDLRSFQNKCNSINCVSFFSGAGGLDLGFETAGFINLACVEINEIFSQTLKNNFPKTLVIGPPDFSGDAKNHDEISKALTSKASVEQPFGGIFYGGPPCQSFSIAANQRFTKNGSNFKRTGFSNQEYGTLLFDFVYFIRKFRPTAFLIENVAGLLTTDDGDQLSEAITALENAGYNVTKPSVLNAADYTIPQNRLRVFIVGNRINKDFLFPTPDGKKIPCGIVFEKEINGVANHVTRRHKAESILRYMELNFGERDQLGRVDRLNPDLPSKTVIAGGSTGGGRSHLHPYIPRTLSVRESARLQTFPDDFLLFGSPARQFNQVGNAVPPYLAFRIAEAMYQQFFK